MVLYAYVLCLRILASLRIPRYDLGTRTPHFLGLSITLQSLFLILGTLVLCLFVR
jgi:hypothetical protein